jgi:hypothetical protein
MLAIQGGTARWLQAANRSSSRSGGIADTIRPAGAHFTHGLGYHR